MLSNFFCPGATAVSRGGGFGSGMRCDKPQKVFDYEYKCPNGLRKSAVTAVVVVVAAAAASFVLPAAFLVVPCLGPLRFA